MSNFLSFKGDNWEYEVFGSGSEQMLAFHGFGNQSSDFKVLEPALGERFKIISFNLPYHGKASPTPLEEGLANSLSGSSKPVFETLPPLGGGGAYTKEDLKELFKKFLAENSIKTFSLMGYSLGGKITLQLLELFPDRVKTVLLFAPDGIRSNWENDFVTNTSLGRNLYRRIIIDPSRLFNVVKLLKTLKIIHPKRADFVRNQLSTRDRRQQVWDVWWCFRKIKPNIGVIQHIINKKQINIHLFFGKYDTIIPASIGKRFIRGLNNKNALHIVESGHHLVKEKINTELIRVLLA